MKPAAFAERKVTGETVAKATSPLSINAAGVADITIGPPGGATYRKTITPGTVAVTYPNLAGHTVATSDGAGVKQDGNRFYRQLTVELYMETLAHGYS